MTMRAYTDDEIEAYVATGEPDDKAGAYAVQGRAGTSSGGSRAATPTWWACRSGRRDR